MSAGSPALRLDSAGLGWWIAVPLAAFFILLGSVFVLLPGSDCDGSDPASAGRLLVSVIAAVVSVTAVAAGAFRLGTLVSGRSRTSAIEVAVVLAILIGALLVVTPGDERSVDDLAEYMMAAGAASIAAWFCLTGAFVLRRTPEEVSLLLPVYLFGAGLGIFPILTWLAIGANAGAFC